MLNKIKNTISNDEEISKGGQRFLSIILLCISGILSLFHYTQYNKYWFNTDLSFAPTFISAILAIFLVSPLYMRNIIKWNRSPYTLFSGILILLVFASFIQLILGGDGFSNSFITAGIIIAITLSWIGIRAIAGVIWILIIILSVYSMVVNNIAFGFYGFVYIVSAFFGLAFHSEMNPGNMFVEFRAEFSGLASPLGENVKSNLEKLY